MINQLPKTGISSPINKVVLTQYLINWSIIKTEKIIRMALW
jgi:hypothetical protein